MTYAAAVLKGLLSMADALLPGARPAGPELQLPLGRADRVWAQILLVEDDTCRAERRLVPGNSHFVKTDVAVRLHQISGTAPVLLNAKSYDIGTLDAASGRAPLVLSMLDGLGQQARGAVVVAGTAYGSNYHFICGLRERGLDFALELPPSALVQPADAAAVWGDPDSPMPLADVLPHAGWTKISTIHPTSGLPIDLLWADFGMVLRQGICARLLVIQTGEVKRLQRGTIFALVSASQADPVRLIEAIGWTRWIRPFTRRQERASRTTRPSASGAAPTAGPARPKADLRLRMNIAIARQQDEAAGPRRSLPPQIPRVRRRLGAASAELKVAEVFSGAGGMGLGFLLAGQEGRHYRLVFSGEVHPIYVETLRRNHKILAEVVRPERPDAVPQQVKPLDLRAAEAVRQAEAECRAVDGIDVLVGGPPCQGFSSANRNSGHSTNPHNELVEVFLTYVEKLRPRVFLMENVQGIVWTPKDARSHDPLSVAEHFTQRTERAGYLVFPKLLDAVWYGVPQHRNRFFLLGISSDLGYGADDFGSWGPFPYPTHGPGTARPYTTVRHAIGDLPSIENGHSTAETEYRSLTAKRLRENQFLRSMRAGAPEGVIWDHVTSRHAEYVIERYRRIPEGGNWQDIADMLSNYADIERTHSNIYRRLVWDEPSVTIGHYRKSMLVHPNQDRGLSLREACRLQSFPDWFRFAGSTDGGSGGLTHKQQQIANAVCPLVTKAIAEFILRL